MFGLVTKKKYIKLQNDYFELQLKLDTYRNQTGDEIHKPTQKELDDLFRTEDNNN